ncbi:Ycf66 family protein [Synechococcus elongatus IITB7]|uniref:Ycf66 family protein n=1 Tax=Synechococcus elongatus TaxID=32046 RepID=UPI0030D1D798
MVNASLNWASIVGIVLAVGGALLYFLRTIRPALARDYDVFFAAVGLLCGGILFFQGWRLDPILQFGQFLLAGTTVFFAYEALRLRGIATEQAKRNTPLIDDDRPVSRVYRYEPEDDYDRFEDRAPAPERRLRGSRFQREDLEDDSYEMPMRSPRSRRAEPPAFEERVSSSRRAPARDDWDDYGTPLPAADRFVEDYPEPEPAPEPSRPQRRLTGVSDRMPRSSRRSRTEESAAASRRSRPAGRGVEPSADEPYVDFQPLSTSRNPQPEEDDNSSQFDD